MRRRSDRPPLPRGFAILWVTVAIDAVGFGIVVPILGLYAEEFGASPAVVGLIVASFSAAALVFAPIMGRLSDRVGRRPLLIVSLFGSAVGSLLTGLAPSLTMLFVGRVVDGASGASVSVARASVADIAGREQRARLFGLLGAAWGLGFVVGPAIGALAALGSARLPFYVAAAIAFANALLAIWRLPETRRETAAARLTTRMELDPARRRTLLQLLGVGFVAMAAFAGFEATFPLLAEERLDLDFGGMGLLFAAIGLAVVLVRVTLIEPITHTLGESGSLRAGLVLNGAGLAILGWAAGWPLVIVGLGALIVGQGVLLPVLSAGVAGTAPEDRSGTALGWQQSVNGVGRILGPATAGLLFGVATGHPFFAGAVLSLVALAVVPRAIPGAAANLGEDADLSAGGVDA